MTRFLRPGWLVIYIIILWFVLGSFFSSGKKEIHKTFNLAEGGTLSKIYTVFDIGGIQKYQLKRFLRKHATEVVGIQPGSYVFSGSYSNQELLDVFLAGPTHVYQHVTILEGWSMYDVDAFLTKKKLIEAGEYISLVTDKKIIATYTKRYDFLAQAQKEKGDIVSLEGYLYPDTYNIDIGHNIVDDLIYLQLESFKKRIRDPYGKQLKELSTHLKSLGLNFNLSTYGALILASIVEKEERVSKNRTLISSVFFNRLEDGMQIDADISLCYGLKKGYEYCTPSVIVANLYDKNNPYNTRAVSGLPPTPISNVTDDSIIGILEAKKSESYFYLHDSEGKIHLGKNISEHNSNKSKYLHE